MSAVSCQARAAALAERFRFEDMVLRRKAKALSSWFICDRRCMHVFIASAIRTLSNNNTKESKTKEKNTQSIIRMSITYAKPSAEKHNVLYLNSRAQPWRSRVSLTPNSRSIFMSHTMPLRAIIHGCTFKNPFHGKDCRSNI